MNYLAIFLTAAVAGAAGAILLTPTPGSELRAKLRERLRRSKISNEVDIDELVEAIVVEMEK